MEYGDVFLKDISLLGVIGLFPLDDPMLYLLVPVAPVAGDLGEVLLL